MEATITFSERPRAPRTTWCVRVGTRKEIRASALGLLRSLREDEGCPRAQVFINGRRVQPGKDGL